VLDIQFYMACMSSHLGRRVYMFDIGCLLRPQFNHCSVVWHFYLSSRTSELLAKVDVLLFRDHPKMCILNCLTLMRLPLLLSVFALCDFHVRLSVIFFIFMVYISIIIHRVRKKTPPP